MNKSLWVMYIIYKMFESRKRNRSSSPSTSSTSAYNKIMATEGAQYNDIIDDSKLKGLGWEYKTT